MLHHILVGIAGLFMAITSIFHGSSHTPPPVAPVNFPNTSERVASTSVKSSQTTPHTIAVPATPKKNSPAVVQAPTVEEAATPIGTLCNGTYWGMCSSGQDFICPTSGDAYCQSPTVTAPSKTGYQLCSETYPNETWDGTYTNGNVNCVCKSGYSWSQSSQSCISRAQVQATAACTTQINQLQQQILDLRAKYTKLEDGALTTGTSVVAEGNAARYAQLEYQEEQPLQAQLQAIQTTCAQ